MEIVLGETRIPCVLRVSIYRLVGTDFSLVCFLVTCLWGAGNVSLGRRYRLLPVKVKVELQTTSE
jgi:hypothetical protein